MSINVIRRLAVSAASALAATLPATASAAVTYAVQSFSPGPYVSLAGLSAAGQIVGHHWQYTAGPATGFIFEQGVLREVPRVGGGDHTDFYAMNESGTAVGANYSGSTLMAAFSYSNGQAAVLPGVHRPLALNNTGQLLHLSAAGHTLVTTGGVTTDIGVMAGASSTFTVGTDINDRGDIVGWGLFGPEGSSHPFLYRNGVMTDLLPAGGRWGTTSDINDAGQVIGYGCGMVAGTCDGWRLTDGHYELIGALLGLPTNQVRPTDLNNLGHFIAAVGELNTVPTQFYAYDGTQAILLNEALDRGAMRQGWTLTSVDFINDAGQIAARGRIGNGIEMGLLLTPMQAAVPEPAGWALLLPGLLLVAGACRRAAPSPHPQAH